MKCFKCSSLRLDDKIESALKEPVQKDFFEDKIGGHVFNFIDITKSAKILYTKLPIEASLVNPTTDFVDPKTSELVSASWVAARFQKTLVLFYK